jgi:DNA polymerase III alpha subunit
MEKLKSLLLERKHLYPELCLHKNFEKRLKWELIEVEVQDLEEYFIKMFYEGKKYPNNENNLLICKLLDIVDYVNLDEEPSTKNGEYPDVDVDYLPIVRDYLKNTWAPQTFGEDKVCNIGNYGTFGLKSTFIDMARVHGLDRSEILQITTNLRLKDDEGEALTYQKALELYPELNAYCQKHPDVAAAVQKLLHRNRSMGKHAGGLILCNQPIDKFVPLVKGSEGEAVSAWVEGLSGQDLGPVGLIKFDLLVVSSLWQIALTVKMVKQRHSLKNISALEGQWDWSDLSYLNDAKCMEMANAGDLKCVFQYDSEGIRKLARKCGMDCFDDLVNLVALYRPGPLNQGMDETYTLRKRGKQEYKLHPVIEPILGKTYGIMIFQEDVMKILAAVGKIPLRDCYVVIKAISKKKIEAFGKYKDKFIENGQLVLETTKEEVTKLFDQIQSFAEYGFNLSHSVAYSYISARQLYLKAHYPLEFYTATLQCESDDEKLRDYISEAINHGVEVCPLDINLSKETFSIFDGKIYIGFSNIKGIGEDKAKRIVELQPYDGFEDFLSRFGTEATVLRALIPLGVFKENNPVELYKFWLLFADYQKIVKDRQKRFEASLTKLAEVIKEALPEQLHVIKLATPKNIQILSDYIERKDFENKDQYISLLAGAKKKAEAALKRFADKAPVKPTLETFVSEEVKIDDAKVLPLLNNSRLAQETYYGYPWDNRIRNAAGYQPNKNFNNLKLQDEAGVLWSTVICEILEVNIKKFKSGKGSFASLSVMDDNFEMGRITIWDDDYQRFKSELKKGNLISIQVCPPSNGFSTYTFKSPPRHKRYELPKEKSMDYRLVLIEESKKDE